jgi:hypothetical protein
MCDLDEGEWPEYLAYLEAARSRVVPRARAPDRPPAERTVGVRTEPIAT